MKYWKHVCIILGVNQLSYLVHLAAIKEEIFIEEDLILLNNIPILLEE